MWIMFWTLGPVCLAIVVVFVLLMLVGPTLAFYGKKLWKLLVETIEEIQSIWRES